MKYAIYTVIQNSESANTKQHPLRVDSRSYTGLSIVSIQYLPFTPLNHLSLTYHHSRVHIQYDRIYPLLYTIHSVN